MAPIIVSVPRALSKQRIENITPNKGTNNIKGVTLLTGYFFSKLNQMPKPITVDISPVYKAPDHSTSLASVKMLRDKSSKIRDMFPKK